MTEQDEFIQAIDEELQRRLETYPEDMGEDQRYLENLARSIRSREQEIKDIQKYIKETAQKRVATLRREIESIWNWKQSEAMQAVWRLTKGKKKSYAVPGMTFGERHTQSTVQWEPEDTQAFIEWAKEYCPSAISVTEPAPKENLKKTALVEYVEQGGALPQGLTYVPAHSEAFARPGKEEEDERQHEAVE